MFSGYKNGFMHKATEVHILGIITQNTEYKEQLNLCLSQQNKYLHYNQCI